MARFLLVLLLAFPAAAQDSGFGHPSGGTFTGGTLASPLVLDATNTLCSQALSLSYNGDSDLGIQRAAANTLALCISGAAALQLDTVATLTVGLVISGVTNDITVAAGQDLLLLGGTSTGSVVIQSPDNATDINNGSGTLNGIISTASASTVRYQGAVTAVLSATANNAATVLSASLGDQQTTSLFGVYGSGGVRYPVEQTATCAANVLTLDPQSSHITIDGNGANCVVTLQDTTATTVGPGFFAEIVLTNVGGVTGVTFPDVANVVDLPLLCSTTGLPNNNSTVRLFYKNAADDLWVGDCVNNN